MVQKALEKAEDEAQKVLTHAKEVSRIPVVQPVAKDMERNVTIAERSVNLGNLARKMELFLSNPSLTKIIFTEQDFNNELDLREVKMRAAERRYGVDAPILIIANEKGARKHVEELETKAEKRIAEKSEKEEKGFFEKIGSWFKKVDDFLASSLNFLKYLDPTRYLNYINPLYHSNDEMNKEISTNWLTKDYLGEVSERFARTPPYLSVEDRSFFDKGDDSWGRDRNSVGLYFHDTNHIFISEEVRIENDRRKTITHEQLHYASFLGGGHNIRFLEEGRDSPREFGDVKWLHEGLTELHAQQLVRAHGYPPGYVSYPAETTTGFYMQQLVGEEALRKAYLTGDFTEVRDIINKKLGEGTFEALLKMDKGVEALKFLVEKLKAIGIDTSEWNKNVIVSRAGAI